MDNKVEEAFKVAQLRILKEYHERTSSGLVALCKWVDSSGLTNIQSKLEELNLWTLTK